MTEEILQAAIMKLRAKATERFGIIKDLYHRPATVETTDQIVQHAIAMAQLEGAMVTLQQYSGALAKQTGDEVDSNTPEELPTEVEVEEEEEPMVPPDHDELMKRSSTYRKSQKHRGKKSES
tara:strand:+ start:3470 stop:3835 length:366 start_codon:yes stop_codon:yes gene_type:complete